jgi:hypothetical protein
MPEANREPISDSASSRGQRNFDGLNSKVLSLAGYSLLAYALYNLIASFLVGGFGGGPEIILSRMTQVLGVYPLLLLGPALIFAPHRASQLNGLVPNLVRWLVLLMALIYLLFVPVAMLNQYTLVQRDSNQIERLEVSLSRRRQEILRAIEPLQSADAFRSTLSRFPEITSITIAPGESIQSIRADISTAVNQAIQQEITRLRQTQQQRRQTSRTTALSVVVGGLIAGLTLMSLASHLLRWLPQLHLSQSRTFFRFSKAFDQFMRRLRKGRSRRPGRR